MIGRVSSYAEVSYLMTLNSRTESRMATVEEQESSGAVSQTYGGYSGTVSQILNVDNQAAALTTDGTNATTALSSMQETYSTMNSITSLASTMLSSLSGEMSGGTVDSSTVSASAQSWLSQLTSLLNTKYAGAYLFSGQASDTAPVNTSASGYDPTADTSQADTGYYQGSDTGLTYTGSDGYAVSTSVQADSPGFEKLFRAISMVAADPGDSTTLTSAYDLIQQGSLEIANQQASLSDATSALTDYQTDASTKLSTLTSLASSLKDSDVASATVQITNYQTQLEAAYSAVSKLASLNLSQYLS